MIRLYLLSFILTSILLFAAKSAAKGTLKIGMGVLHGDYNAYPASNERLRLTVPYPAFEYKNDRFRANNSGGIFNLMGNNWIGINVTVEGSLPASSKAVVAREGMRDLELLGEIGPNIYLKVIRSSHMLLRFDASYHGVFSIGETGNIGQRGSTVEPSATLAIFSGFFEFAVSVGRINLDRGYAGYLYDVRAEEVLTDRPEFTAQAGELGDRIRTTIILDFKPLTLTFRKSDFDFKRSINKSSPLHLSDNGQNFYAGLTLLFEL